MAGQMGTGKSTVAGILEKHGYMVVEYSTLLKVVTVIALNTALKITDTPAREPYTLSEVIEFKEDMRPLIREIGTHVGFDNGGPWVDLAVKEWEEKGKPKMVLDCVRTNMQIARLMVHGIQTVELKISKAEGQRRAQARGATVRQYQEGLKHTVESEVLYPEFIALKINATRLTPEQIAERIMNA